MKISNVVENNNEIKFVLQGVDCTIANGLRRTLLSDIPCVIMKTMPHKECKVNITKNTSRFNNEIIKQRLSCIPVHITDMNTPIDQLELELDVENETEDVIYVTTHDIKIKNTSTNTYLSKEDRDEIFPANPMTGYYIDIVRLRPRLTPTSSGEHLTFKAKLSIATVDDNSMYNMVSTCCYGNTKDEERVKEQFKIKEQELKDSGIKGEQLEFMMKDWSLLDAQRYYLPNSFDFTVKTIGVYTCKEILKLACDRLIEKSKTLIKCIEKPKTDTNPEDEDENTDLSFDELRRKNKRVDILKTTSTIVNGYDVLIHDEDYTIGMMLQYMLYSAHYEGDKKMSFCGFKKFHPHDTHIMVRVGYTEQIESTVVATDFLEALNNIISVFDNMKGMF